MRKNILIYSILLISLIGISLFLTSNFLEESEDKMNDSLVKNIFQADQVKLKISFFDKKINFFIKSEMLNSLANSDYMRLFRPEINFDDNSELKIFGTSKNADYFYKSNIISFIETVKLSGLLNEIKFSGTLGDLKLNLDDNTAEISKGLEIIHKNNIYYADSILVDLSNKKILNSVNVRIESYND